MNKITVEVSGPAGVGKSAIVQLIAMLLSKVELNATLDLNSDLRSMDDLQVVVDSIKERTQILVCEVQEPRAKPSTEHRKDVDAELEELRKQFVRKIIAAPLRALNNVHPFDPVQPDWKEGARYVSWPLAFSVRRVAAPNGKLRLGIEAGTHANLGLLMQSVAILTGQGMEALATLREGNLFVVYDYPHRLLSSMDSRIVPTSSEDVLEFNYTQSDLEAV